MLGIVFSPDVDNIWEYNYTSKLEELKRLLSVWKRRKLTLYGRICIIKSLGLSKLVHLFLTLPRPPALILRELNSLFFQFIWEGPDKIKRNISTANTKCGGLCMTDLDNFIYALKTTWIRRLSRDSRTWQLPFDQIIQQYPLFWVSGARYMAQYINDIHNPFWKDIVEVWMKFISFNKPEKVDQILNEPLWCNDKCRNQKLLIQTWAKVGILFLKDILNNEGKFLTFPEFKTKYNVRGTFLDYLQVTTNIPNQWVVTLTSTATNTISCLRMSPTLPMHLHNILKHDKGCRHIYELLNNKQPPIASQRRWVQEVPELEHVEWSTVYQLSNFIDDTKLKEIHFRIVHRILTTKTLLLHLGITENDLCSYCANSRETIKHLYLECPVVQRLWADLENWLRRTMHDNDIALSKSTLIAGYTGMNQHLINHILLVAKHYIYRNKFSRPDLHLNCLINMLRLHFKTECMQAELNMKQHRFAQKWAPLLATFS